jgi:hypothetical protein
MNELQRLITALREQHTLLRRLFKVPSAQRRETPRPSIKRTPYVAKKSLSGSVERRRGVVGRRLDQGCGHQGLGTWCARPACNTTMIRLADAERRGLAS